MPTGTPGEIHFIDNGAGWRLACKRVLAHGSARPSPRPALIIPGYGMNSFIFGFHPRGLSLEAYLASRGIETWSVDLREHGRSVREHGSDRYGLGELAVDDLGVVIRHVLGATRTNRSQVDLIGCSLGAALAFAHVACVPDAPVGSLVSMGGLVTWVKIPAAVRAAFAWPWLVGKIRMKDTRRLAGAALPAIARWAPKLLSVYLNAASTDVSQHEIMVQTVEDPNRHVSRQIAEWVNRRDLVVRGVNVSGALRGIRKPLLCVVANNDGIVPPETSRAVYEHIGSCDKELLEVGDAKTPIAHADLFLSTGAQERIFAKVADFLLARA